MDFVISDEHRMIQSTIRKLVDQDIRPRLAGLDPDAIELPEKDKLELREKVKKLGMQAMGAPVEYGGGGVGTLGLCLAAEELAKHRLGSYKPTLGAFCGHFAGEAPGNLLFCNTEQRERYLLPVKLPHGHFEAIFYVQNLFDTQWEQATFAFTSRLPNEPAGGVQDIHFVPGNTRFVMGGLAWYF